MTLEEIMRLIFQGLLNVPMDAPERDEAFQALGGLYSKIKFTPPAMVLEMEPAGFTHVSIK